jgi:ubiquinone/menaquinone biosynthesis C-methylase UbiE
MDLAYLESIRLSELESVLTVIKSEKPGRNNILEIGAGTGYQAKKLSENGYTVEAIDFEDSTYSENRIWRNYSENRIWPILNYDGEHIPFPNSHFDIVFSSNVLEHISNLPKFQVEIKRVLKPDGIVIHGVPSGTWRFWTNVAHYAFKFKTIFNIIFKKVSSNKKKRICNGFEIKTNRLSKIGLLKKMIFPSRHGKTGTALSEILYFSKHNWYAIFTRSEWEVKKYFPNRLFYTGYMVLGSALSIQFRKHLSCFLGSSCHFFVLTKGKVSK